MCSLCAALGGSRYWTDAAGRAAFARGGRPVTLRQERSRRVALLNAVLAGAGLSVADWGGNSYVVKNAAGRSANVYSLTAIWNEADALAEAPADPLDPVLVAALAGLPGRTGGA